MKRINSWLLLILILISGMATAQVKQIFDLDDAKKQAIRFNRTLKNSGLAIDKAQSALKEAISAGLPQVSSTVDYTNAMGAVISIRFNEDMPVTEIPIKPTSNFNLQVGQLIFNGSYFVGIELAKLGKVLVEQS